MLKIGLVSPFLPEKDGIAIYSDNILNGLNSKKKNIVTIGRKGSQADYLINFKSFSLKKNLEKIIKREKLNLIHIQYVPTLFGKYNLNYNLIRALDVSIPVIVTLHEVHYSNKGMRNKILGLIERAIIKKVNSIIVHTPKQKSFLQKKYRKNNIFVIYHGLRLNQIPKRKPQKKLLCFGMISHGKGVPYLIKAMEYLPNYNLMIAGKFVDKQIEKDVKDALKNSTNVNTDFGWISEEKKETYYKKSNAIILPHIWAPYQSGILHNAVAWGLPVVVTRTGALYELVELFKFGEIVKPKNAKAIAEGIKQISKNNKKYQIGIKKYRELANWQKIAQEHLKIYKKLT